MGFRPIFRDLSRPEDVAALHDWIGEVEARLAKVNAEIARRVAEHVVRTQGGTAAPEQEEDDPPSAPSEDSPVGLLEAIALESGKLEGGLGMATDVRPVLADGSLLSGEDGEARVSARTRTSLEAAIVDGLAFSGVHTYASVAEETRGFFVAAVTKTVRVEKLFAAGPTGTLVKVYVDPATGAVGNNTAVPMAALRVGDAASTGLEVQGWNGTGNGLSNVTANGTPVHAAYADGLIDVPLLLRPGRSFLVTTTGEGLVGVVLVVVEVP